MKKTLILASVAALMLSTTMAIADTTKTTDNIVKKECNCKKDQRPNKQKMQRPNLDEKLNLTEEQKKQAHDIRMQGHEKIKPIVEKMKAKHAEIKKIAESNLSDTQKEKKINKLEKDLLELKQQARKIRTENMKEFETILTPEQKTEFEKLKKEGRAKHKMPKGPHKPGFEPKPFKQTPTNK